MQKTNTAGVSTQHASEINRSSSGHPALCQTVGSCKGKWGGRGKTGRRGKWGGRGKMGRRGKWGGRGKMVWQEEDGEAGEDGEAREDGEAGGRW